MTREGHVLLLTDGLRNGGAERQFALYARALAAVLPVRVVALRGGTFEQSLETQGVLLTVVSQGSGSRTRAVSRAFSCIWATMLRERPSLVHSWGTRASIIAGPACRVLKVPLVNSSIRTGRAPGLPGSPQSRLQFSAATRHASAIISNSRAGLKAYRPPERVRPYVIYNAFDASRLARLPEQARASGSRGLRVVMSARMVPGKDFGVFLETADLLAEKDGDRAWCFVLAGDGPQRHSYMAASSGLIQRGIVEFATPTTEPLSILASCDIGVLLTDSRLMEEGCSNSLLEYMACGLPTVCNDVGGNREVVKDGVTGIVIRERTKTALAGALEALRRDKVRTADMAAAARRDVANRFSSDALLEATLAVYQDVLEGEAARCGHGDRRLSFRIASVLRQVKPAIGRGPNRATGGNAS